MFLLHEHAPLVELAAISLVCSGMIAIGISHRAAEGATTAFLYALGTGLTIGIYTVIDGSGVRSVAQPLTYVLWFFVAHGLSVLVTAPSIRGKAKIIEARKQWKLGIVTAALSIVTYGSAMLAFRFRATAQLAALRRPACCSARPWPTVPRRAHDAAALDRPRHDRVGAILLQMG